MIPYGYKRFRAMRARGRETDKHLGLRFIKARARRQGKREARER